MEAKKTYTIREAAKVSGLPESTLRYYETIGLIKPVQRDASSKYRVYIEEDVNLIISIACLSATGLSIEDMRTYLQNRTMGADGAYGQVELLTAQKKHLEDEIRYMQLRIRYVEAKISYWNAVASDDPKAAEVCAETTYAIADEMKLPKTVSQGKRAVRPR